jgi:hypothetical protein
LVEVTSWVSRARARIGRAPASARSDTTATKPRRCYFCRADYHRLHAHYHLLCPTCAAENVKRRDRRCNITGRRALITGGRIEIGFQTALELLRDGAEVIATTRGGRCRRRRRPGGQRPAPRKRPPCAPHISAANGIGPAGVKALVDAMDAGAPMTALWLKRNPICDEGAFLIADLLHRNTTLRTLALVNTELTADGVRALCGALAAAWMAGFIDPNQYKPVLET